MLDGPQNRPVGAEEESSVNIVRSIVRVEGPSGGLNGLGATRGRGSEVDHVRVDSLQDVEEKAVLRGVGPGDSNDGGSEEPSRQMEVSGRSINLVAEDRREQGLDGQGKRNSRVVVYSRTMCLQKRSYSVGIEDI